MSRTESVRFKGTRQGVNLVIDPGPVFAEVLLELDQRLKGSDQFFRSAAVMLNLEDREIDAGQFASLREVLHRYGLEITSAQAAHTDTRSLLRGAGIEVKYPGEGTAASETPAANGDRSIREPRSTVAAGDTLVVHRTLRSGQSLHHAGDLCLIGDVNPGAEVVAGDNVIVWGSLRGAVQAGTRGNEEAVVCALELAPTLLRIASVVTRQPEAMEVMPVPEMARIVDGQIVVEQWLPRSRRLKKRI